MFQPQLPVQDSSQNEIEVAVLELDHPDIAISIHVLHF